MWLHKNFIYLRLYNLDCIVNFYNNKREVWSLSWANKINMKNNKEYIIKKI